MIDKEKVRNYYLQGLNSNQIAKILKCTPPAVRKCIERNCREFKKSHLAAKMANKEVDKVTRREAKKFMSDATFIKKNRSVYKTDEEGNIKINENVAPVVTFDTPRRFKNENSLSEINKRIINSGYKKDELFG